MPSLWCLLGENRRGKNDSPTAGNVKTIIMEGHPCLLPSPINGSLFQPTNETVMAVSVWEKIIGCGALVEE